MRTDDLFFEFFKLVPNATFELFQFTPLCRYEFEAPVVKKEIKKVERRMDGLLKPTEAEHPHYFVEFQGYNDKTIYWRLLHQISLYHELEPEQGKKKWQAFVIFLDSSYDPGLKSLGSLAHGADKWLHTGTLGQLLNSITNPSPVLDVLRPVIADSEEVQEKAPVWAKNLSRLRGLTYVGAQARLQQIFVQFVIQKLTHLSRKEIDRMLGLTPLEQTVAGKELIELGRQEAKRESIIYLLTTRFGPVSPSIQAQINAVTEIAHLDQLFSDALTFTSFELFKQGLPDQSS